MRTLPHHEAKAFYDRFGARQDSQARKFRVRGVRRMLRARFLGGVPPLVGLEWMNHCR
jgi:hypothetical protein